MFDNERNFFNFLALVVLGLVLLFLGDRALTVIEKQAMADRGYEQVLFPRGEILWKKNSCDETSKWEIPYAKPRI